MEPLWIWLQEEAAADSYGEFYTSFDWEGGETEVRISADSDYTLFLNGRFVNSDQYKDFPYCKVYDRLDITPYLHRGVNHMAVVVWHYGIGNFSYYPGPAGLWYAVSVTGKPVAVSGAETQSRLSRAYLSHARKNITFQLGFSFFYRADREDGWKNGELNGFSASRALDLPAPETERPVRKLSVLPRIPSLLIRREGNRVFVQAGASLAAVAAFARDEGLCGLAELGGIPGTLGGGVLMNAGAYGAELGQIVERAEGVALADGRRVHYTAEQLDFGYRHSALMEAGVVVTDVTLALTEGDPAAIRARMEECAKARREKQPLNLPSAGSTFKRPEGHFAAKLIDDCGLRGLTVGGAQVSEKHAGFVVNLGGATARDVLALMRQVEERVFEQTGVQLEPEVHILGTD